MPYNFLLLLLTSCTFPLAGAYLQQHWKNQLGDIYSLGLGSAACLGAASASFLSLPLSTSALLFCILSSLLSFLAASFLSTKRLLTFGLLYGSLIGSLATIVATNLSADALSSYYKWCSSTFSTPISAPSFLISVALIIVGFSITFRSSSIPLSILGIQLACTATIFQVGFVGMVSLIIPNIASLLSSHHLYRNSVLLGLAFMIPSYILTTSSLSFYLPFSAVFSILISPALFLTSRH